MPRLQAAILLLCSVLTARGYQQAVAPTTPAEGPLLATQTTQAENPAGRPAPDSTVVLRDGQAVVLRNLEQISSKKAQAGEPVKFEVIRAISSEGVIVIPEHAVATGKVLSAEHAKLVHHGGKLSVAIESVQLANGQQARLRAVQSRKERDFGWRDVAATTAIAATIYYLPLAPVYVLAKGDQASMPAGTRVTAYLDGDLAVSRASLEAAGPPPEANPEVATIYIFRGNQDKAPSIEEPVSCGRVAVGTFSGSQYMKFEVTPGRYWCYSQLPAAKLSSAQQAGQLVEINAVAGQSYYLQAALVPVKYGITKPTLQTVDESIGAEEVFKAGSRANTLIQETGTNHPAAISATPKGVKAN